MTVPVYTGTVPSRTQSQTDFNINTKDFLNYINSLAPALNAFAAELVALADVQVYSGSETYNTGDTVYGSDGITYRCTNDGVTGDDPVGSVTGNWIRIIIAASDITITQPNQLLNGKFDFWDYGTTATTNGYSGANRWYSIRTGTTNSITRQSFSVGQTTVPGNPQYYCRNTVVSSPGANNVAHLEQRILNVRLSNSVTKTFTFYAKADATKNIAIEGLQNFGSGGSGTITGIGSQKVQLTTSWQQFSVQLDFPSISGKTIGSDSYFEVRFWFDAGSTYDSRTDTLGQQSGTFDIALCKVEDGDAYTGIWETTKENEYEECQRYYLKYTSSYIYNNVIYNSTTNLLRTNFVPFPNRMIKTPTITLGTNLEYLNPPSASEITVDGFTLSGTAFAVTSSSRILGYVADSEI